MSITLKLIANGVSRLPGGRHLNKWQWGKKSFSGLTTATSLGVGTYFGYMSYGHTYGTGTAAVYGIASANPITSIPLMAIESAHLFGEWAHKLQQSKRVSSFAKKPIDDKFGTINKMRQFSGQQMRRDHSSGQRVLSNEAIYLHR